MAEGKAEPPNTPWAGPHGSNCGRAFPAHRDSAGEAVTKHSVPREVQLSSQLSWGFNDTVKLQLLPLETNYMFSLIVCYEPHTGSRMLPS